MNKILIEVYVPVAEEEYDIFVPANLMMSEVIRLISKVITELSEGLYDAGSDAVLCNREDGTIYNINLSVDELGLRNGSRLMLI